MMFFSIPMASMWLVYVYLPIREWLMFNQSHGSFEYNKKITFFSKIGSYTFLGTNISFSQGTFEDYVHFPLGGIC